MSLPGYVAHFSHAIVPAAAALDAATVKLRIPVTDNLKVIEFGVRVVGATAATSCVLALNGEPVAGGTAVELGTATCAATATQGKSVVCRVDKHVLKSDYSFITVGVKTVAGGAATGIVFAKVVAGGSGAADTNDIIVTV